MFDGLLFDLDGTLWDSVDAICTSWNQMLARRAPELAGSVTRQRLLPCMGMLLPDIAARLLPQADPEQLRPLLRELLEVENRYVAVRGDKKPVCELDQCGLSASVGAEEPYDLPPLNGKVQIGKSEKAAVFFRQSLTF